MSDRYRINVELTLRSGRKEMFAITEEILGGLELFQEAGLSSQELCKTLAAHSPWDPPAYLRVFGNRADGSEVRIELPCEEAKPEARNGTK